MKTTINTRDHGEVTFFTPDNGGYVWVDLNGRPGTLGRQICDRGGLMGSTISYRGTEDGFERLCRRWWSAYLRRYR
jgi:hypothetical protein